MPPNSSQDTAKTQGKYTLYVAIISGIFALIIACINRKPKLPSDTSEKNVININPQLINESDVSNALTNSIDTNNTLEDSKTQPAHSSKRVETIDKTKPSNFRQIFSGEVLDMDDNPIDSVNLSIMVLDHNYSTYSNESGWYTITIANFPSHIEQVKILCKKKGFKGVSSWTNILNPNANFKLVKR